MISMAIYRSNRIAEALAGKMSTSELSEAELSALRLPVYHLAAKVLRLPSRSMQAELINAQPDDIQTLLRKECRRVYEYRKGMP